LHLFKEETYPINGIIYKEQEPVEFAYIIFTGEVEVIFVRFISGKLTKSVEMDGLKRAVRIQLS
jgi:hypothetical protein